MRMNRADRLRLVSTLGAVALWMLWPQPAAACPFCKDPLTEQLAGGYFWSIMLMVSMPFLLVIALAAMAYEGLQPGAIHTHLLGLRRLGGRWWATGALATGAGALILMASRATARSLALPADELLRATTLAGPVLDSGRLRDRVVVVTFFATWCPACRLQLADLQVLQQDFGPARLSVVGVNVFEDYVPATDTSAPQVLGFDAPLRIDTLWRSADGEHPLVRHDLKAPDKSDLAARLARRLGLKFSLLDGTPGLSDAFGTVARIPSTYLFDRKGRLVRAYINPPTGDFIMPEREELRRELQALVGASVRVTHASPPLSSPRGLVLPSPFWERGRG
jgi:thiol-disulfide isomerase/thioredoxin